MDDDDYTRDDLNTARGVAHGLIIVAASVFAGWLIWTLMTLPGIP
jgi:hypothetical protein